MTAATKGKLTGVLVKKTAIKAEERPEAPSTTKLIFVVPTTAKKQFDIMAATKGRTKQDLLREALNDLFQKYGESRIA